MSNASVKKGNTYYLDAILTDENGNGVNNQIINYSIYRMIDNTLIDSGVLAGIGNGIYSKPISFKDAGQYRLLYIAPNGYDNSAEIIYVEETDINDIELKTKKILGLVGSNVRSFDNVYNEHHAVLSAKVKIYETKEDAENDVNPIATYLAEATYNESNELLTYKRTEI